MAKLNTIKPSCGSEAITVLIDQLCIRCDAPHTGPCRMLDADWQGSSRYKRMENMTPATMIKFIRFERAEVAMGRAANA